MNERIQELAEQNGFIHQWMPPGEQHDLLQRYEKFAELIVRECAELFDKNEIELSYTMRTIHNTIKEHFGIK